MSEHDCNDILAILDRYLDREVDEADRVKIEVHLRGCSPCLEAFDFQAEFRRLVRERCREATSEAFRQRVLEALRNCPDGPAAEP